MSRTAARVLFGLPGLFILGSGLAFLLNPAGASQSLRWVADGAEALSNVRAFLGAPVAAVGASLLLAAWTAKLEYARAPALFLLLLLGARIGSYLVDGAHDAIVPYLAVPTVAFGMMAAGHALLARSEKAEGAQREAAPLLATSPRSAG